MESLLQLPTHMGSWRLHFLSRERLKYPHDQKQLLGTVVYRVPEQKRSQVGGGPPTPLPPSHKTTHRPRAQFEMGGLYLKCPMTSSHDSL